MLLAFVVVLFAGLVLMFYMIYRNQENSFKALQEDHGRLEARLRLIEARLPAPAEGTIPSVRSKLPKLTDEDLFLANPDSFGSDNKMPELKL